MVHQAECVCVWEGFLPFWKTGSDSIVEYTWLLYSLKHTLPLYENMQIGSSSKIGVYLCKNLGSKSNKVEFNVFLA